MTSFSSTMPCVETIKAKNPISSIIGQHVELKRCGAELRGCCPFHSDRTPSFYVNDRKGMFHCFGCGAGGDVIEFMQRYFSMTFNEVFDALLVGGFDGERAISVTKDDCADRSEFARKVWAGCCQIAGTPAAKYLERRGLPIETTALQKNLRFGQGSFDGSSTKYPMLVAAVRSLAGEIVGLQRVFLKNDGSKLSDDCKRSLGELRGAAVRISRDDEQSCGGEHIYLCEGIEDALSVARINSDKEVWATLGVGGFGNVELPDECNEVTIAHDNDEAGHRAAEQAAERFIQKGLAVNLLPPPAGYKDWNAYLMYWELEAPPSHYNELPWKMSQAQLEELYGFTEEAAND